MLVSSFGIPKNFRRAPMFEFELPKPLFEFAYDKPHCDLLLALPPTCSSTIPSALTIPYYHSEGLSICQRTRYNYL